MVDVVSAGGIPAGLRALALLVEEGRVPADKYADLPMLISVHVESAAEVEQFAATEGLTGSVYCAAHSGKVHTSVRLLLEGSVRLSVVHIAEGATQ